MKFQKNVFIVMPFGKDNNAYKNANQAYDNVVKPLCEKLELEVVRADDIASTGVVYNDITQGICNSDIVIVDISGKNPNVMYELGIAHSLRQQTTIIITQDDVAESPFDIAHFRIISYENSMKGSNDLRDKLHKTIETIQGKHKLISKREFEYCLQIFNTLGRITDLGIVIGLKNYKGNIPVTDKISCKVNDKNGAVNISIGIWKNGFNPLIQLECLSIKNNTIFVEPKGIALAEFLEEQGYSCELSLDGNKVEEWMQLTPVDSVSVL